MMDLIILGGIIYLASRVFAKAFDSVYALFCRRQFQITDTALIDDKQKNLKEDKKKKDNYISTSPKINKTKPVANSPQTATTKIATDIQRQPIKKLNDPPKQPEKIQNHKGTSQEQGFLSQHLAHKLDEPQQSSEIIPQKINSIEYSKPVYSIFPQQSAFVLEPKKEEEKQEKIFFTRFNQVESPIIHHGLQNQQKYEKEIESLLKEIEKYREEKKLYIQRIEDIIQHVVNHENYQLAEETQTNDQLKLQALYQLKIEINNSHKSEKEKENQLIEEMRQIYNSEKNELKKGYELRINQLQSLFYRQQEDNVVLQQSINQLKELQRKQLIALPRQQEIIQTGASQYARLVYELQQSKYHLQNQTQELSLANKQLQQTIQICQVREEQISKLKQKLMHEENNQIELTIKFNSKIESLQLQKAQLEKQLTNLHQSHFKEEQEIQASLSKKQMENVQRYQIQIEEITNKLAQEQRGKQQLVKRVQEVQEELKFCQTQIELSSATQTKLRDEVNSLRLAQITQKPQKSISLFEVQNHPQFLKLKIKLQNYENQLKSKVQKEEQYKFEQPLPMPISSPTIEKKINYARPSKERDPSPLFASSNIQMATPPDTKAFTKAPYRSNVSNPNDKPTSVIFTEIFERKQNERYKTPFEKPSFTSSIHQNSNFGEIYFGQTNILKQNKRNFVIGEINRLKKIAAKKTKLMYRSLAKNSKPISEFISNVPNLFVVIELANKKILGAFTQTAFATKDTNGSGVQKSKYMAQNKAMIMDITEEKVFINASTSAQETIKYDQNALVWGKYEFVVSFIEPLLFSCDLNCQNGIYPCSYSNQELMGANEVNIPITQFEVFRIFLG